MYPTHSAISKTDAIFFFFSNYTTQCFNKFKIFFVKLRNKGPMYSLPKFLSVFIFTASVAHFTNIHLLYGIMKYRIPLCIWFAITDPQFIATCHKKGQFDYKCFFFLSSFELIPHKKKHSWNISHPWTYYFWLGVMKLRWRIHMHTNTYKHKLNT